MNHLTELVVRGYESLRKRGVRQSFGIGWAYLQDYWFDLHYGTDTMRHVAMEDLIASEDKVNHGYGYQPTQAKAFAALLNELRLPKEYGFVDFGCGKGRVLLLAAKYGFQAVRGVEFSHALCELAKSNIERYSRFVLVVATISIFEGNAEDYVIQRDENIFYFFNPFDDVVFKTVLDRLQMSVSENPRPIYVIYRNPLYRQVLEHAELFQCRKEYRIASSHFIVYSNMPT